MADIVKFDNDEPNRLLESEVTALSAVPLVGILLLTTDQGSVHVAINEGVATQLIEELETFLSTEEEDEGGQ